MEIINKISTMDMVNVVALLCTLAGFLMIVFGYLLSRQEKALKQEIENGISESNGVVSAANEHAQQTPGAQQGAGYNLQTQAASTVMQGAKEYVEALAELAKNLKGLTPAVASFITATILFFFAGTLVTADRIVPSQTPAAEQAWVHQQQL